MSSPLHQTVISFPSSKLSSQLAEMACIRMYMAWGFFDKIPTDGSSISYAELASSIGADEALVRRLGQMLVATGKLRRPSPDRVAHSRLSPTFKAGNHDGDHFTMMMDEFQSAYQAFPRFFEKYGPRVPEGETKVPFCFPDGVDGKLTYWELIAQRGPDNVDRFGRAMQGLQAYAWPYTGIYDFSWVAEYAKKDDAERPLIMDIGGGQGQMLRAVLEETPGIPRNRCYLQDRTEVIRPVTQKSASDPVLKDVQKVVVNFHKEQPVKGKGYLALARKCETSTAHYMKYRGSNLPHPSCDPRLHGRRLRQYTEDRSGCPAS